MREWIFALFLFACFFRIGSQLYPLSLSPTSTTAGSQDLCIKRKVTFPHLGEGRALPSYCSHPGGHHFTSHAASRLEQEPLSFPWPLMLAHSSSVTHGFPTTPCLAQKCCHMNDMELLLHLQSCSTAYQHTAQCQVPLLGTAAVHRKLGKFTANSLCALAKMTHSSHTWFGHHEPSQLPRAGLSLNPADSF